RGQGFRTAAQFRNVTDGIVVPVWGALMILTVFLSPFVSMRLFAEEQKQKTFELLMTAPVRPTEIVLGKFLGGFGMMGLTIGVGIVFPLTLAAFGGEQNGAALDWSAVLLGYGGLLAWTAACIAVGMFISSLTESQFLAAFITLAVLVPWWLLGDVASAAEDPLRTFLQSVAFSTHLTPMLQGETDLAAVVFFPSVIVFFLFLTQRRVEAFRWA
ncbi:MAG: ABC transporter permease subunit, partial [Myxococcaceae bacterium]|nr:ABC transporter permease subunit [Myxococcaceae bacterium]